VIGTSIKINGKGRIRALSNKMMETPGKLQAFNTQFAFYIQSALLRNLREELGDKGKYFDVRISSVNRNFSVKIVITDDKGAYLYHGTSAHKITSDRVMPMPDGGFTRTVHHPGQKGISEQVKKIVIRSIEEAKSVRGKPGNLI
jgi:hypothetical protein